MGLAVPSRAFVALCFAFALGVILGSAGASAALAAAASASPWISSSNSKVRIVSGTVELDGKPTLMAGIQLRMNPAWKTYWRNPGDSGVPPIFDWTGSTNLKRADVLYPAPHRFADGAGTAIGYEGDIVFPVKLTPEREGEPISLKLAFGYGLCKDLCIPNTVDLSLTLNEDGSKGDALLIETFLARVPRPAAPGVLPEVEAVRAKLDDATPELLVDAMFAPDATGTDLFIDAGDVFVPMPRPLGPISDGRQRFAVTFASAAEAEAIKGKSMTLTLVSDQGSTDTVWKPE